MQKTKDDRYKVIILYHQNDISYQEEIQRFLEQRLDPFQVSILGISLEQLKEEDVSPKNNHKLCSVILLVSKYFLETKELSHNNCKSIAVQGGYDNIIIQPVYLDNSSLINTPFRKTPYLDANQTGLYSLSTKSLHQNLEAIAKEIAPLINVQIKILQQIKTSWDNCLSEKSISTYTKFIEKHPHSIYTEQAEINRAQLIENKNWKNAIAFDNIPNHITYISESERRDHVKKAMGRITRIEQDEGLAKKDVDDNYNFALLLKYKLQFRNSKSINEINNKAIDFFSNAINKNEKQEALNIEANLLEWKICNECPKEDLFDYILIKESFEKIYLKLSQLTGKLVNDKKNIRMNLTALMSITFLLYLLYFIIQGSILFYSIIFCFSITSIYFIYYWNHSNKLNKNLKDSKERLIQKDSFFTKIKVAFLTKQSIKQNQLFFELFNLEEWIEEKLNRNTSELPNAIKQAKNKLRYLNSDPNDLSPDTPSFDPS